VAVSSTVVNIGLDSLILLQSLYWTTMAHQVLEEYDSLPRTLSIFHTMARYSI